ncbi:uncharacterized protein LOC135840965 [Planococcus citri]|uniref:uncharacterized protein LOC135840965 n=1 Tax=Planococcus citri TaxID=170843 RepID=UPI0031F921B0
MAGCDKWAFFKALEVVLCLSSLLYKWWTDEEASRLYFYLEKRSREWPLLRNVTWNQAGSWFADVTFGGYTIITIALLIAHVIGELRHTRKTELFLLGIGSLLFFGCGCMIITSFDNVPESLFDNAIILGLLAIITGFVFLIDIGCFNRREQDKVPSQDKEYRMQRDTPVKSKQVTPVKEKPPKQNENVAQDKVISELRSSIKKKNPSNETTSNHKTESEKQTKENIQPGRKHMENRGFSKKKPVDEHDNAYDYDEQSIRNYDSDSSEASETPVRDRYERKSRGSQIGRSYIMEEKRTSTKVKSKDAETITDSHIVEIQSSRVTTTSPNKSDSQTSEESYELHPPPSTSLLLSKNGKRFQPTLTTTRIERISQNAFDLNQQNSSASAPSSPQDPGYVLHTASKWPNTNPVAPAPQSYQQFKEKNKVLRPVHSVV